MPVAFESIKKDVLLEIAKELAATARTAPKARGIDDIIIEILSDQEREEVARKLEELASERNVWWFKRDADNVRNSSAVIVFGVKGSRPRELNCGACGYKDCAEFSKVERRGGDFVGPNCVYPLIDLGIALGSAVKLASILGIDNRIMYTVGLAVKKLNLVDADLVLGLPLSATGKSIYFDRPRPQ
ncbi:MAG: ferredoxin domain-containing protein [Nitrososphaeria archaeon]